MANDEERKYRIYKYTNVENGKIYIGLTCNSLSFRARGGHNYAGSRYFYHAIQKYGWDAFIPEILEDGLTHDEACERERYYIAKFNSRDPDVGYNITEGGECGAVAEETRKIISEKAKERYKDPTKNPMYGKHHTEEAKRAIGEKSKLRVGPINACYGKKFSPERLERMSEIAKSLISEDPEKYAAHYRRLGELARGNKYQAKPIRRIEDGKVWESTVEAAAEIGVSKSTLCGHLRGYQHSCHGYHFEYVQ